MPLKGLDKSFTHNRVALGRAHAAHCQNAQIRWVDEHEPAIAIGLRDAIFSRSTLVLWRRMAGAFDMHLDTTISHNLMNLGSSMLGRREDLIM